MTRSNLCLFALAPVALLGLVVGYFITAWVFRASLGSSGGPREKEKARRPRGHPAMLVKGLVVTAGAVVLFFVGASMPVVALGAAAILLLDRVNPERIYRGIDWGLLVMFAGLFVVVRAFGVHVVSTWGVAQWHALHDSPVGLLSLLSAALSNLVSNVPAVLLFEPIIPTMPAEVRETAWLALAVSSTFAGNLTVLGSVANLIVVEQARREGVAITLGDYCRVGIPVTIVTLALGAGWLWLATY